MGLVASEIAFTSESAKLYYFIMFKILSIIYVLIIDEHNFGQAELG